MFWLQNTMQIHSKNFKDALPFTPNKMGDYIGAGSVAFLITQRLENV